MTREYFLNHICCIAELIDFCYDYECNICDEIYDEDGKNEYYDNRLYEMVRDAYDWQDLKERLDSIPCDYDYYVKDDNDQLIAFVDDDFDYYLRCVLDWCDDNNIWEQEEEDDSNENEDYEEDDESGFDLPEIDVDTFVELQSGYNPDRGEDIEDNQPLSILF